MKFTNINRRHSYFKCKHNILTKFIVQFNSFICSDSTFVPVLIALNRERLLYFNHNNIINIQ